MSAPRRLGVLGGTFDPVHLGHLVIASEACHALDLDEVLLVPAGIPWQKHGRVAASAEDRVRMVELAVAGDERLRVSRVDVDREGPTYSIDTVRDLRRLHGADTEIHLLVGADALAGLPTWHAVADLVTDVVVVGIARPGHAAPERPEGLPADHFVALATTPLDISATALRARVRDGAPIRYLVPTAVEAHIRAHELYGAAA
jgi:nicotinate-nucleotide adenylyltransferase